MEAVAYVVEKKLFSPVWRKVDAYPSRTLAEARVQFEEEYEDEDYNGRLFCYRIREERA